MKFDKLEDGCYKFGWGALVCAIIMGLAIFNTIMFMDNKSVISLLVFLPLSLIFGIATLALFIGFVEEF